MGGVTPEGERVLRGAARACKRTGCPISTHQWAPEEVGRRQVEIFAEEGAPMDRICIGHSADTTDVEYLESLLREGVYLSMDRYPGGEGPSGLAAAQRHGEGADRPRLGAPADARARPRARRDLRRDRARRYAAPDRANALPLRDIDGDPGAARRRRAAGAPTAGVRIRVASVRLATNAAGMCIEPERVDDVHSVEPTTSPKLKPLPATASIWMSSAIGEAKYVELLL